MQKVVIDIHIDRSSTVIDNIKKWKLNDSALQDLRAFAQEQNKILAEGDIVRQEYNEFFNVTCEETIYVFSKVNMEKDCKISGHTQSTVTSITCNNHYYHDVKFFSKKYSIRYCENA